MWPDLRSDTPDLGSERPNLGSERPDTRYRKSGLKLQKRGMDRQKKNWRKSPYGCSAPPGPLHSPVQSPTREEAMSLSMN